MPRPQAPLRSSHSAPTLGPVPTRPDSASCPSRAAPLLPPLCPYRRFAAGLPASLPRLRRSPPSRPVLPCPPPPVATGLFFPSHDQSPLPGPLRRCQSRGSSKEWGAGVARRRRPLGQRMLQRLAAVPPDAVASAPADSPDSRDSHAPLRLGSAPSSTAPSRPALPATHPASPLPSCPPTPRRTRSRFFSLPHPL